MGSDAAGGVLLVWVVVMLLGPGLVAVAALVDWLVERRR